MSRKPCSESDWLLSTHVYKYLQYNFLIHQAASVGVDTRLLLRRFRRWKSPLLLPTVSSQLAKVPFLGLCLARYAPWLFLGGTSWSRGSKLAAGMARLVLALNLLLDLMVMVMVEAGTHLNEPWFRWHDGVVPFYFQAGRHTSNS